MMGDLSIIVRNTVRIKPKHEKMSFGDYKISKQWFRVFEKLMHRLSDEMEPRAKWAGVGGPLAVNGWDVIIFFLSVDYFLWLIVFFQLN